MSGYPLHVFYQLLRIAHSVKIEGHKFPVTSGGDAFQVFGGRHLHQFPERDIFYIAPVIRLCLHQCLLQDPVHGLFTPRNSNRKILLVGMQHGHAVFTESRFQDTVKFVIGDTVKQQSFLADAQVQLVLKSDPRRIGSGFFCQFMLQVANRFRNRSLCPVTGIKLGCDIRLTRHEELLEYRLRWRERNDRKRITFLQSPVYLLFQWGNLAGSFRTEIKFRFGRGKLPLPVQDKILPADRSRLFQRTAVQFLKKRVHTLPVFIHVDILIPFYADNQLVFFDTGHPLLVYKEKEEYAERNGNGAKQYAERFMTEHPVHSGVIETVQCMVFYRVIECKGEPLPFPGTDTCTVDQQVKDGKQHDTGKIRHQQPDRDGESLVVEDGSGNAAHKNQGGEYGDGGQRGAQHGRHHLAGPCDTGTAQGIPPFAVLRDILGHDDRAVNHHSQGKNQSGKGDDIQ